MCGPPPPPSSVITTHPVSDIRLYDSKYQEELYPFCKEESILDNTSRVDVDRLFSGSPGDLHEQFPKFRNAAYVEAIVQEGDMLYIPPKWWHFVKSLSTSFSVSFWWD